MAKKSHAVRGKVLAFNMSPKGDIEGVLDTVDGTAQVNFPKHAAAGLAKSMKLGGKIEIAAEPEPDEGDHPVYLAAEPDGEVMGTVVRLNYALHGEVNGFHLDDGTFVHTKPKGAKKWKLAVGDTITATGAVRTGSDAIVLEAESVAKVARKRA